MEDLREAYVEIIDRTGQRVVTVIELLSLFNKTPGERQEKYLQKQSEVLRSGANLVEIDLLHGGRHTVVVPRPHLQRHEPFYALVCVWRAANPLYCEVYFGRLQNPLPRVRIPFLTDAPQGSIVPEPITRALRGVGLAALVVARRRKRR